MSNDNKTPPLALRYGLSEERMEEIRDAIKIVVGGMVAKQIPSYKAVTSLCVLFRIYYDNPNYEKTPEQVVLDIITRE